jgi:hypothetical protein
MTKTPWAHLPNAQHIDAVLADVKARPEAWTPTYRAATQAETSAVSERVRQHHNTEIWAALSDALDKVPRRCSAEDLKWRGWAVHRSEAESAAQGVIDALILWDSTADLLDCTPDVLRAMIDLAEPPVCHQAALLLPYAIVRMTK